MCSHYQAVTALERFERHFKSALQSGLTSSDMWPQSTAAVVRKLAANVQQREASNPAACESILARWGLIASNTRTLNTRLSTFNARSETVATSPTFGHAWANGQRCIVPSEAIYEPDWQTGRHVPTQLQRADGKPMGIAGLWDSWVAPSGETTLSFTMLTINADTHPLMRQFHKPLDEKRMVVILQESDYAKWLDGSQQQISSLLQPYPADALVARREPTLAIQNNPQLF
jgi:putative SOS response-associated peptidase YedK